MKIAIKLALPLSPVRAPANTVYAARPGKEIKMEIINPITIFASKSNKIDQIGTVRSNGRRFMIRNDIIAATD